MNGGAHIEGKGFERARMRSVGFTLIEIMAAMAVLAVMIVFLANVFTNTGKIWKIGNKRVESNNNGRAAIEFIARELSSALVNGQVQLGANSKSLSTYGVDSDRIAFAAASGTPQEVSSQSYVTRQLKQSVFAVISTNTANPMDTKGPFVLVYHNFFQPSTVKDIYETNWKDYLLGNPSSVTMANSSIIAENVRDFEVFVYDQNGNGPIYNYNYPQASPSPVPPAYIDIYLEVLAQEDATKASLIGLSMPLKDMAALTHRYHTRVYMQNALGAARD